MIGKFMVKRVGIHAGDVLQDFSSSTKGRIASSSNG